MLVERLNGACVTIVSLRAPLRVGKLLRINLDLQPQSTTHAESQEVMTSEQDAPSPRSMAFPLALFLDRCKRPASVHGTRIARLTLGWVIALICYTDR